MEHSPGPVGTAHKKINPMAELPDMNTREKFWQQDQEQEKVSRGFDQLYCILLNCNVCNVNVMLSGESHRGAGEERGGAEEGRI